MLDFDGLVGSLKPVVDALVTAGILLDDRWSVLGAWSVDQKFREKKAGPMLEILVQELPADMPGENGDQDQSEDHPDRQKDGLKHLQHSTGANPPGIALST